ncbi:hypothetical protein ILUMI_13047 [Ignelater luminosus]|uniref:Uncharacterized protein n=1 Tax=Ignelater luminosus TaxID=2038154 RepID=A0A8K0GCD0_IGNLU|nr:hypothetical protein ILUMI_13047 [Ignelater luminosus]
MEKTISIHISNTPHDRLGKERQKLKPTNKKRRIKAKVAEGDVSEAIRLLCSEDNLAPKNEDTYNCLLEKLQALGPPYLLDTLEAHGLSCQKGSERSSRHAANNNIINRTLESVGLPSILEPVGLMREDGKRPDGLTLVPWRRGRSLTAGAAADTAEKNKIRKYQSIAINYGLLALAMKTLGEPKLFNNISGDPCAKSYPIQRISLKIQR